MPFAQTEKGDVLPVFQHRPTEQLGFTQVSSPHHQPPPHGRVPSNMPSTPTLNEDHAPTSRSRQSSLARRVGMTHPSPSMEFVSSPAPPAAAALEASDARMPINFSMPSQTQPEDGSTSYSRDPYSLRRPPTAARKKPSFESLPSSTTLVEPRHQRPAYALFTRRTSSGGGGHHRQPSFEDSSRYAPRPIPPRHHRHTPSSDSSIMALYAAAQQIAESGGSQDKAPGGSSAGMEEATRRPNLLRAANGSSVERLPSVRKPVPPAPKGAQPQSEPRLQPPLSRLSERTNERSMATTATDDGSSSTDSMSKSLPSKRGILPAEPPSPSWEGGSRHQREAKQKPATKGPPQHVAHPAPRKATPPRQTSPPGAASGPIDSRLAALRRLVSDIHHNNGSDSSLRSYFSPDTPDARKTPGGSLVNITSYFDKKGDSGSAPGSAGGSGGGSGVLETPEPSVQRGSRESPILPRNSQVMMGNESSEDASATSRDGQESAAGRTSDYTPQPSYEAPPSRIPVFRRASHNRLPLPRTPSFTYSEETVRPEHGAGGRPLPSTQTANTLVGGEGSQDVSGSGGGGAKGSPASAYSSLGYGRHLSKVGSFQDYIKQQVGGEQQGSYPSAAYYHQPNGVA